MGGSSPIDDLGNMLQSVVGGAEEMITHDKAKRAAEREKTKAKERTQKIMAEKKNVEDTDRARQDEMAKRASARAKQKSGQQQGRAGTILTDSLGEGGAAGGGVSGTLDGGKTLLGI